MTIRNAHDALESFKSAQAHRERQEAVSSLTDALSAAQALFEKARVRSAAGARRYGLPIGAEIPAGGAPDEGKSMSDVEEKSMPNGEQPTGVAIMAFVEKEQAGKLAVENGERPEDMHVTLLFAAKKAAEYSAKDKADMIAKTSAVLADKMPFTANAFAIAHFNPDDEERDPCTVLLVQSDELKDVYDAVDGAVGSERSQTFPIWIPHVTLAYGKNPQDIEGVTERVGQIIFDRVCVGWAGDDIDVTNGGIGQKRFNCSELVQLSLDEMMLVKGKTFPRSHFHAAHKDQTCSRWSHGPKPPKATKCREVEGKHYGACAEHAKEMMEKDASDAVEEAKTAMRRVASAAGARHYGKPIGSLLDGSEEAPAPRRRVPAKKMPATPRTRSTATLGTVSASGHTIPSGMKPYDKTKHGEMLKARGLRAVPPAWTDVHFHPDESNSLQVVGWDAAGRRQPIYSTEHTAGSAAAKYERVEAMQKVIRKLDGNLKRQYMTNDEAAVLMLIRRTGMRPDTGGTTNARVRAYGATSLAAKHVNVSPTGVVRFDFVGKDGVHIKFSVKDPELANMFRDRLEGKRGNDPLFDTNPARLKRKLDEMTGSGSFKVKDLRTYKANAMAMELLESIGPRSFPKTQTEYRRKRREIAASISYVLGNTPTIVINSYVNPVMWDRLNPNGEDWK